MKKLFSSALAVFMLTAFSSGISENRPGQVDYLDLIKNPSPATVELTNINPELEEDLIQVADNVHVAMGYAAAVFTFIEGDDGIILIDGGQMPERSADALKAYRKISDKPVKAIVFTHSHGDHLNGASAFVDPDNPPQAWARDSFGAETAAFRSSGIRINMARGVRQAGFKLPPELRINNGVAPAVYPKKDTFNPDAVVKPTHFISGASDIEISGIRLRLVPADGETADQMYIYYGDKNILFAGDNFYQSWPNLYAIRGTPYRDVQAWVKSLEAMRRVGAGVLVGGHTRPIIGKENVEAALTSYRDGIVHLFEKTIEGINKGLGPDELVAYAKLPPELEKARVLRPYYGNPDWAVRAIFNGYLGWYDGNPTNLFPLPPKQEAERVIKLAGGKKSFIRGMLQAHKAEDNQWAAQLADYLLTVDPDNVVAMRVKADALTRLGEKSVTSTARNYYLTTALELKQKADRKSAP